MIPLTHITWGLALLTAFADSAPSKSHLAKRCTHSATSRDCWDDNFDISSNWYDEVPETGVTREYYLELTNITAAPDGVSRNVLTVNGTFPGPTLYADWGDTVKVTVYNGLENNGTSIHFHGIRQNYTNQQDGVASITQCPTAPGESITYTWRATQYGSSWYHSHFALQAWEGVAGAIIINGPATANYDDDLGPLLLTDWSHETADALYSVAETSGPPTLENGLINGTNTYKGGGSRFETTFEAGKSYRIRLINGAIDTHFKFMIDNHSFQVIAMDLVPIVPYEATMISIGMGQRYDIIVTANQTGGDFWMRSIPQTSCSENDNPDDIKGIVRYDASSTADPTTSAYSYRDDCLDEDMRNLVPYVAIDASESTITDIEAVTVGRRNNVFKWFMSGITFDVEWEAPMLMQVYEGNTTYPSSAHVIEIPDADEWFYFIIQTANAIPHPIHLHGHDFFVLGQGSGAYSSSSTALTLKNPPRRDVAMLPASGYLVIGFQTDNPGAWLMHCHIGWHTSDGFALQILERVDEIMALTDSDVLVDTCSAWSNYAAANNVYAADSGV